MVPWASIILLFAGGSASFATLAAEILRLDVESREGEYRLVMEATLEASPVAAWEVLTDYAQLHALSPSIVESRVLESPEPKKQRITVLTRLCILVFCKDIRQTQAMTQKGEGDLWANIESEGSDFEYGWIHWRLLPHGASTRLRLQAELRPAFKVPPVIGPWVVRHLLRREAWLVVMGLEHAARERRR